MFKSSLLLTLVVTGGALCLSGCSREYSAVESRTAVAPVTAPPSKVLAVPIPTPDPLLKFRRAHEIPQWSQGQLVEHVVVKPGEKPIALTFDDGPWPQHTKQILAILAGHRAKATFYMLGKMVQEYPEIALQVRDAGHAIGGHSWSHPSRPKDSTAEIAKSNAQFQKVLGFTPSTFRPPYGSLKNGLAKQAMRDKQAVILWSADSDDWKKPSAQQMTRTILNQARPGGIILFHDGGGSRHSTVKALPAILRDLKARGYRFVTVPELLRLRHAPAPPAKSKSKPPAKRTSEVRLTSWNGESPVPILE